VRNRVRSRRFPQCTQDHQRSNTMPSPSTSHYPPASAMFRFEKELQEFFLALEVLASPIQARISSRYRTLANPLQPTSKALQAGGWSSGRIKFAFATFGASQRGHDWPRWASWKGSRAWSSLCAESCESVPEWKPTVARGRGAVVSAGR
jgi:hypothetical protein